MSLYIKLIQTFLDLNYSVPSCTSIFCLWLLPPEATDVGAWWLGFPILTGLFILLPSPLVFFPKWIQYPNWLKSRRQRRLKRLERLIQEEKRRQEKEKRKKRRKKRLERQKRKGEQAGEQNGDLTDNRETPERDGDTGGKENAAYLENEQSQNDRMEAVGTTSESPDTIGPNDAEGDNPASSDSEVDTELDTQDPEQNGAVQLAPGANLIEEGENIGTGTSDAENTTRINTKSVRFSPDVDIEEVGADDIFVASRDHELEDDIATVSSRSEKIRKARRRQMLGRRLQGERRKGKPL